MNTSYEGFSICLNDLRDELRRLQNFVEGIETDFLPKNHAITQYLHDVLDHASCLIRDLPTGHLNYTVRPSNLVNVQDKQLLLQACKRAFTKAVAMIDDYYVDNLYAPLWVCRHKMSDGKEFWVLSNIAMEMTLLLGSVSSTATVLSSIKHEMIAQ